MKESKPARVRVGSLLATPKWAWCLVAVLTVIGTAFRIKAFGASMFGDELSTIWIVKGNSLGEVISRVYSDSEITPPFYFVLAWLSTKLGSDPALVRLPALIAGVASIPVVYALGVKMVGRYGALAATAIVTFSPFFIAYSAIGRAYSLGILMLFASTLFMLVAIERRHWGWWFLYAVFSGLAIYSHYTMVFVLIGQFLWLLWAHPRARRAALLANIGAACFFLPWFPGFVADNSSITTPITEAIQGYGLHAKLVAVEQMLFYQASVWNWEISGRVDVWLITIASIAAGVGALYRGLTGKVGWTLTGAIDRGLALALVISLSTLAGEAVLLIFDSNVFGGRNLSATWAGLPFLLGGLLALNGPILGVGLLALLVAGFGLGAVRTTDASKISLDYKGVADYIESIAGDGDVVLDAGHLTPAPTTSLSIYLPPSIERYSPGASRDEPDFIQKIFLKPDPQLDVDRAFSKEGPVQVVTIVDPDWVSDRGFPLQRDVDNPLEVPPGWRITEQEVFPGAQDLVVTTFERDPNGNAGSGQSSGGPRKKR